MLFTPADEADLAYFLKTAARRSADQRHRSRLEPAGARWRRAGHRDSSRARLRRDQGRAGQQAARRDGGARRQSGARGRGSRHSRARVLSRHSGLDRRRAAHECRRARPRDEGLPRSGRAPSIRTATFMCCRSPTWASRIAIAACRDDWIFTEATFRRHARRAGRNPQRDGRGRRLPREEPADQGAHRRLDVQESAGPQRLEARRRGGLPGLARRRRQGFRDALQFPDQRPASDGRRRRDAGRDGSGARQSPVRRHARLGNHPSRRADAGQADRAKHSLRKARMLVPTSPEDLNSRNET